MTLADAVGTSDVDVQKLVALGLPAQANGAGVSDGVTHLVDYVLKPRKTGPKFRLIADVRVTNPCGELVVTLKKPNDLLVPAHVEPAAAAPPPAADTHEVADFHCYSVKVQKKRADGTPLARFPKGVQLDAVDQFQSALRAEDAEAPVLPSRRVECAGRAEDRGPDRVHPRGAPARDGAPRVLPGGSSRRTGAVRATRRTRARKSSQLRRSTPHASA